MNLLVEDYSLNSADIFITEECNLKCLYCFHKQSPMTLTSADGKLILDKLHEINPEGFSLTFFGGEPLLYPQLVLELAEYAKILWADKVKFYISTNGTYFDEEMFKRYKELGFRMQVSIDGDRDTTLQYRLGSNFDVIIQNTIGILKLFPDTNIRMTYTPKSVARLYENIKFIISLGVRNIMHHAVMEADWDDASVNTYANQLKLVYNYRRFLLKRGRLINIAFVDKCLKTLNGEIEPDLAFCGAGRDYIAVLPNGEIYPCHRAASNRIFKLGNLLTGEPIIRGMFLQIDKDQTKCYGNCPAAKTCHSCIITHYLVNGSLYEPIKKYCNICKAENYLALEYLPTELNDIQDRKFDALSHVLADLTEEVASIQEDVLKLSLLISTKEKE